MCKCFEKIKNSKYEKYRLGIWQIFLSSNRSGSNNN